jgi:acetyl esterase/lipase
VGATIDAMAPSTHRLLPALAVVAALLGLAACGSGGRSGAPTSTAAPSTTASSTTTSPATSSTGGGATTPSTTAPASTTTTTTAGGTGGAARCADPALPSTVAYRRVAGVPADRTSLDVWTSPQRCGDPVLVWVHGGGYRGGDKANQMADKRALAAAQGWVLVSVDYRLSDGRPGAARYPDHYEDVAAALAWVHAHIADYGGDPGRVALAGHSAGADIVANVVAEPRYLAAHGLTASGTLRCLAPLDTEGFDKVAGAHEAEDRLWRAALGNDPDYATDTSATLLTRAGGPVLPTLGVVRGTPTRRAIEQAYLAAVAERGAHTVTVDAATLTHAEVNRLIGAEGDTVVTPPLVDFLHGCFA